MFATFDCETTQRQLKATVQGSIAEKIFFYALVLVAALFFAMSSVSTMMSAATDIITSVNISDHGEFAFPATFFCVAKGFPDYEPDESSFSRKDLKCKGIDEPAVKVVMNFDGTFKSRECVGHNNAASEMKSKIEEKLSQLSSGKETFFCSMFDKEELMADRDDASTQIIFEGETAYKPTVMSFVIAGFYDAKAAKANPNHALATMRYYFLNGHNTAAEIGLEYDTELDLSHTFQFTESTSGDRKKLYRASVNQAPIKMLDYAAHRADTKSPLMVRFSVGSFLGRNITLRKKSFMEVWREIGGCWASALLLLSIFYVRRSTTRRDGSSVETQVLRFRGEHSKLAMLKELKTYWETHSEAVQDVSGKTFPDPEAAVCAGTPVGAAFGKQIQ